MARAKMLLVEDDASVRTTIVTFLELEGFGVEAVSSTRDALLRLDLPVAGVISLVTGGRG